MTTLDDRPTVATGLDLLRTVLAEREAADPRALQVETGASQAMSCRAESLFRLLGIPESDHRLRLDSLIGKAAHAYVEEALKGRPGLLVEHRATYRDVPCTIDLGHVAAGFLWDWKFPRMSKIRHLREHGVPAGNRAQVHLGAAALRAEGHDIHTVGLAFLPRDGELDDAYQWSEPFSESVANEAADRVAGEKARAREMAGILDRFELREPDEQAAEIRRAVGLWDLRDEDWWFCREYCPFATACRGPEREHPDPPDAVILDAAQQVALRAWHTAEAKRIKAEGWEGRLDGYTRLKVDGAKLALVGGNPKSTDEIDMDRVLADYRLVFGEPPTRTVESTTARYWRVTFDKAAKTDG